MTQPTKCIIQLFKKLTILGLFVTLNIFHLHAQKVEIENKFHIKQDGKSITFRVLDTDDSQLKRYHPDKNYYWFKSQKVLVTQGGSSGSLLDGYYESFYKNNQLAEKGLFKKGLKEGVWMFWDPNGILIHQEKWSKGTQKGKQLYYSSKGIVEKTVIYKGNQTQIVSRDTTILKTKKVILTTVTDSTGKLISRTRYSNFQLDGTQVARDQNDSLIRTVYKKGVLVPEKVKTKKEPKIKNTGSEKQTFKEKMKTIWGKVQFWKKFKKKEQSAENQSKKEKKENREAEQPVQSTEKKKRRK